jgi:hypothetical protein
MLKGFRVPQAMGFVHNQNVDRRISLPEPALHFLCPDLLVRHNPPEGLDLPSLAHTLDKIQKFRSAYHLKGFIEARLKLSLPFGPEPRRHDDEYAFDRLAGPQFS